MPPLSAGALNTPLNLETRAEAIVNGVITPTWSAYASIWAAPRETGFVEQLESEQASPRRTIDYLIRREEAVALPLPLRIQRAGLAPLFVIAAQDDPIYRDQTSIKCVEGIDLSDNAGGERATLYRGTDTEDDDASESRTWAEVAADVAVRIDDADAAVLAREFGAELAATLRGVVLLESDVRVDDGLTITTGRHKGLNVRVAARRIDPRLPAQAYYALALARTDEAFV